MNLYNRTQELFKNRISSELDLIEIVFENKTKDYGAYVLRKDLPHNLSFSMWIVVFTFILFTVSILIFNNLGSNSNYPDNVKPTRVVSVSQLSEPPSIVDAKVQRIHTSAPQKVFKPPKVMKDEKVLKETEFRPPESTSTSKQDETIEFREEEKKNEMPPAIPQVPPTYFVAVDFMPEPIGDIQSKVVYPSAAKDAGIEGRVFIKAFIDENGTVVRTEVIKGLGYGCDEAAEKAVLRTRFRPGKQKGNLVKVQMSLQVSFRL